MDSAESLKGNFPYCQKRELRLREEMASVHYHLRVQRSVLALDSESLHASLFFLHSDLTFTSIQQGISKSPLFLE